MAESPSLKSTWIENKLSRPGIVKARVIRKAALLFEYIPVYELRKQIWSPLCNKEANQKAKGLMTYEAKATELR